MAIAVKSQRRSIAVALLVTLGAGALLTFFVGRGGLSAAGRQLEGMYVSAASAAGVQVKQPVLVLAPGTELIVDGQLVKAFGYDECPKNGAVMQALFGPDPDLGNACIRLDRERVSVHTVGQDRTDKKTVWTVRRDGERVRIFSADGEPIRQGASNG
ncbi:hypothetical protein [Burkholderia aenigmatica]|uniref:hypothetical protein n=1 Tax=Burkholderia aenigmatica TaxID=2015348 RepID=UPI002654938F|nr:hypothetical protein [Burkholderia aenigmatica]MDN7880081.1 hypothetical protein [Burkholderia aenigmatica]